MSSKVNWTDLVGFTIIEAGNWEDGIGFLWLFRGRSDGLKDENAIVLDRTYHSEARVLRNATLADLDVARELPWKLYHKYVPDECDGTMPGRIDAVEVVAPNETMKKAAKRERKARK